MRKGRCRGEPRVTSGSTAEGPPEVSGSSSPSPPQRSTVGTGGAAGAAGSGIGFWEQFGPEQGRRSGRGEPGSWWAADPGEVVTGVSAVAGWSGRPIVMGRLQAEATDGTRNGPA